MNDRFKEFTPTERQYFARALIRLAHDTVTYGCAQHQDEAWPIILLAHEADPELVPFAQLNPDGSSIHLTPEAAATTQPPELLDHVERIPERKP